ncbi:hypothetical protein BH18THE2_BH18THE2_37000 [soil metagenome]
MVTGSIIAALLAVYFSLMWNFFPAFYSVQPAVAKGLPTLTEVSLLSSGRSPGSSFDISVTGFNRGETTDIQIVSISFPNMTGNINFGDGNPNDGYIKVKNHNFSQSPLFVASGDIVGSRYSGGSETTAAKYPSVEFFSRPWKGNTGHHAEIEVNPASSDKFVILVKAISLPHFGNLSHYPQDGLKDYQEEFVEIHSTYLK